MANKTGIPSPEVPFVDPKTGLVSREWYRFLSNVPIVNTPPNNTVTGTVQPPVTFASPVTFGGTLTASGVVSTQAGITTADGLGLGLGTAGASIGNGPTYGGAANRDVGIVAGTGGTIYARDHSGVLAPFICSGVTSNSPFSIVAGARENGYCGYEGYNGSAGSYWGVGVNFKSTFATTPASVTLSAHFAINAPAVVSDINQYGFEMNGSSGAGQLYWFGNYYTN